MTSEQLMPPLDLIHWTGSESRESFNKIGQEFLGYFRDMCGLQPNARILDMGCGCGRMAIPLARYLAPEGSFVGIDVDERSVQWAADNITPRYPNVQFQRADVFNLTYNANGRVPPYRYRLPFPSASFDFISATSLFTHMLPPGLENYMSELARVLRIGGQCLLTFFLLNEKTEQLIQSRKSEFDFPHRWGCCAVQSMASPENVVGYDEAAVIDFLQDCGLEARQPLSYGYWNGRQGTTNSQDIVIARKVRNVGVLKRLARKIRLHRFQQPNFTENPRYSMAA